MHLLVGVVGRQQVIHAGLRHGAIPAQRADLVHAHLARDDGDTARVDQRLDDAHGTIVEIEGVGVVRRTAEQFDVPRLDAGKTLFQAGDQRSALQHAHAEIVKRGVVVDIAGLGDETVIGEHLCAGLLGLLQDVGKRRTVDGGDDQNLGALGHHVLDLRQLVRNVVLAVLQIGVITESGEFLHHRLAVRNPAGGRFGGHRNTHDALAFSHGGRNAGGQRHGKAGGGCGECSAIDHE